MHKKGDKAKLKNIMSEHNIVFPVIKNMVRSIEEQKICSSQHPNYPMDDFLLKGFTDEELNTFIMFLKSFDFSRFNNEVL